MARSIYSLRSQKNGGSRSSNTSWDSDASSACDRGSDTSSTNSDSREPQDTSSTYSANSTDSTTAQVDSDHKEETSSLQPPFSPRMIEEDQRRPEDDGLPNYARDLLDLQALYVDSLGRSPPMDVKQRSSSIDSIHAVWGSPKPHSERFLEFQSSRESEEAAETRSSRCPNASERYTAQSSTRYPNPGRV
ncbi:hypothetical protein FPRO06_00409 [Fusarium proliferatum]|nr:hypothetical protein FPRO03_00413 [Fusarium proliferatum]KAG4287044.1 hypothetical protein FPRO04_00587 [Fusarium proliferatum]KAG4293824.1 hypothetical protein FPRO06_00409 [Fusarium proliferatum]